MELFNSELPNEVN